MRRLLIRPGAIGDCILALPELESHCGARTRACRVDTHVDACRDTSEHPLDDTSRYTEIWAPRAVLPLIQFAHHTRAIADTGLDLVGISDNPRTLETLATFDSIYSWYGSNRDEFRDAVRHLPFTFFPALPINRVAEPRIRVPLQPVENFAVIHPSSGSPNKNWPLENFRDLATRLDTPTQFCAGPNDVLSNATRIENLFDLACWLSTARVYIGNDSGITHLAAAVGVPTIAIFLTTDSRIWAPRGDHVIALENPSVEAVIDSARRVMRILPDA